VQAIADVETLNLVVSEATASSTVRAHTIGLSLSATATASGGSGADQSVIITGTESLTIDTAVAADVIDASGMTAAAVTDSGLTMGAAFTASTTITGQTITGTGKVDVLRGSTGADTINGGAGVDTIHANAGADTIDGGAGVDTFVNTGMVGAVEGTGAGTSTGIVVNLSASAITAATVVGTVSQNLSGSLATVGAGKIAYVYNGELSTNSAAVDTISNVENIDLSGANGINYVVGSAVANTITGGSGVDTIEGGAGNDIITGGASADTITGGEGVDSITGGAGADTITLTETTAAADTLVRNGDATTDGVDTVTGFAVANDIIDFTSNGALVAGAAVTAYAEGALGAAAATTGVFVLSDNITVSGAVPTEAEIETYLGATVIFQNGATNDSIYIVADDGTDTYVMLVTEGAGGTDKQFDANDDVGTVIMKLSGIADATTLSADNFADFT